MAPLTIINVVVYSLFTYAVRPTSAQQQPDGNLGQWYAVIGDQLNLCVFPFRYDHVDYSDCRSGYCATVANFSYVTSNVTVDNSTYGMCSKVVQRDPAPVVSINYKSPSRGKCYGYTKIYNTSSNDSVLYVQLKTYVDCQQHCDTTLICRGINFDSNLNYCFLRVTNHSPMFYAGQEYDYYTRYSKDTYTMTSNTISIGGILIVAEMGMDDCLEACSSFINPNTSEICVGVDFDKTDIRHTCYIHTDMDLFNNKTINIKYYQFKRHACIPAGNYEYTIIHYDIIHINIHILILIKHLLNRTYI